MDNFIELLIAKGIKAKLERYVSKLNPKSEEYTLKQHKINKLIDKITALTKIKDENDRLKKVLEM
jgi:hypothetical protein